MIFFGRAWLDLGKFGIRLENPNSLAKATYLLYKDVYHAPERADMRGQGDVTWRPRNEFRRVLKPDVSPIAMAGKPPNVRILVDPKARRIASLLG